MLKQGLSLSRHFSAHASSFGIETDVKPVFVKSFEGNLVNKA